MPGFDKTGPAGEGPMTGGGRGVCASPDTGTPRLGWGRRLFGGGARGAMNVGRPRWGLRRGSRGRGRGRGRGRRW